MARLLRAKQNNGRAEAPSRSRPRYSASTGSSRSTKDEKWDKNFNSWMRDVLNYTIRKGVRELPILKQELSRISSPELRRRKQKEIDDLQAEYDKALVDMKHYKNR